MIQPSIRTKETAFKSMSDGAKPTALHQPGPQRVSGREGPWPLELGRSYFDAKPDTGGHRLPTKRKQRQVNKQVQRTSKTATHSGKTGIEKNLS